MDEEPASGPTKVTRSEALAVARQHLEPGEQVRSISRWSEITGQKPWIWGMDEESVRNDWVVYLQIERPIPMLCSSEIIVIGADGAVRYKGTASDEG